jgi:hypothetical protein
LARRGGIYRNGSAADSACAGTRLKTVISIGISRWGRACWHARAAPDIDFLCRAWRAANCSAAQDQGMRRFAI